MSLAARVPRFLPEQDCGIRSPPWTNMHRNAPLRDGRADGPGIGDAAARPVEASSMTGPVGRGRADPPAIGMGGALLHDARIPVCGVSGTFYGETFSHGMDERIRSGPSAKAGNSFIVW